MHEARKYPTPDRDAGKSNGVDATLLKRMVGNPSRHFDIPHSVVDDPNLSRKDKVEILDSWEHDARILSVATEENMDGGEGALLKQVQDAKRALGQSQTSETGSTKMGG